jgi:hypothetical protein
MIRASEFPNTENNQTEEMMASPIKNQSRNFDVRKCCQRHQNCKNRCVRFRIEFG